MHKNDERILWIAFLDVVQFNSLEKIKIDPQTGWVRVKKKLIQFA